MWIALSSPKKEKGIINSNFKLLSYLSWISVMFLAYCSPYLVENNLIIVCFFFCITFKQLSSF